MPFILGLLGGVWSLLKKYWLEIIVILVVAAVVYMIHQWGYNDGYDKGAKSRDKEVAQLKEGIRQRDEAEATRIKETNDKIDGLEKQGHSYAETIQGLNKQLADRQATTIIRYRDRYPLVAQQCGWSAPTVDTIRELLY